MASCVQWEGMVVRGKSLLVTCGSSPLTSKRRRVTNIYSTDMDIEAAKAKLAAMKEKFGREIHVFETSALSPSSNAASSNGEETDDFYEFTAEDYYRLMATKKEDKFLKTRKIREAEEATHRSRITKAVIRVRFPDNHTLEATFHPSETVQCLIDLLTKVIAQPEQPFHICDSTVVDYIGPYLHEEVLSLKGLDGANDEGQQSETVQCVPEPVEATQPPSVQERKPADKKLIKPKMAKNVISLS
ncbi:Ubiquitin-like domain superfamily [Sesbania bispinosa]|nr:Ubiquitin-like domain superfamily [Sesbania bispinosa]